MKSSNEPQGLRATVGTRSMAALHLFLLSSIGNEVRFIEPRILHYCFSIAPLGVDLIDLE